MRLRSFLAKDMKEALATMRAELGDEAIIVASETLKDGSVLLRAGLEVTQTPLAPSGDENDMPSPGPGAIVSHLASLDARYRDGLVARLRAGNTERAPRSHPFDHQTLLAILRTHRVPDPLARTLAEEAKGSGLPDLALALAWAFDRLMGGARAESKSRGALLLVGLPGSGKTSAAARLAAQNCLAGLPARLAATDLETAGQFARLESLAACLDVPLIAAATPDILAGAIQEAREAGALLIADSAGADPRESLSRELVSILSMGSLELAGVISAASDAEEAGDIADALIKLGATRLIVTGLDLTRRKGALVALACSGLPLAHVTASPYLADGLETLTPLALSRAVLANGAIAETQKVA